jgi:ribonuclease BN (tRNA processing enzyme)
MGKGQRSEVRGQWTALIILFCVLSGVEALAAQPLTPDPRPLTTSVVILGTGNPNPDPDRSGPAVAIVVNGVAYLVDAGAGVMRRAEAARRAGAAALAADRMGVVFLTHLHSDHTIGLPDVMHTGWVAEREAPLRLFGPPGTKAMAGHLVEAWSADIANRRGGFQPHTGRGWQVEATDVTGGVVYRDSNVTVTAIPVPHAGWPVALGYRFQTRDRIVVVSGDTRPTDAVVAACNGCDVLVHEVYSTRGFATRTPPWQKYHTDAHTSSEELAALAGRARPKLLVLYHQLYWGATDDELLQEVRRSYGGAVVSARDLGIY